jgi:hypothetical protein
MKNVLKHGVLAGLLAGIVSVVYQMVYSSSMVVDFSAIANPVMIVISSIVGSFIAGLGYWFLRKRNWLGAKTDLVFNSLYFILSFVSIYGTFGASLPEGTAQAELFPGLVIPMHFFPVIFWLTLKPVFEKNKV